MLLRGTRVVAGHQRHVHDLLERVTPGLARLELDHVEDLIAVVQHQVVEAQQDLSALGEARASPRALRVMAAPNRGNDVVGRAARHGRERLAGGRILDFDSLALARAGADEFGKASHARVRLQLWPVDRARHATSKRISKKLSISGTGSSAGPT